nr:hypothetical protein [Tanacetum cinerariifolium]
MNNLGQPALTFVTRSTSFEHVDDVVVVVPCSKLTRPSSSPLLAAAAVCLGQRKKFREPKSINFSPASKPNLMGKMIQVIAMGLWKMVVLRDTKQRGSEFEAKNGINGNNGSIYAKMVTKDIMIVNNKLDFVPTEISEEGSEIVIFDEALMDKDMKADGTCMFKFRNEKGIKKSTERISVVANSLKKPLIMDNMTAKRCQLSEGRMDFARVLVKFGVTKGFKEKNEIQYRDMNNNKIGSKHVNVEYAWKLEICSRCHVFGHGFVECTTRNKSEEEIAMEARRKKDLSKQRDEENRTRNNTVNNMENKRGNERRYGKNKGKEKMKNRKNHNEEIVVQTANKFVALDELEDDNVELEKLKGRMIVDVFLNKKLQGEVEEMNGDIEDVLEVDSGIAKELSIKEILLGYFNVTLKVDEHSAEGSKISGDMHDFMDCVNDIEMEDVNSYLLLFTKIKSPSKHETSIMRKLDRVMSNVDFIDKYGGAYIRFHHFMIFDHSPVVMHILNSLERKQKSFRFFNYIANKKEFLDVVKRSGSVNVKDTWCLSFLHVIKQINPL